jgi:hypothetical protein
MAPMTEAEMIAAHEWTAYLTPRAKKMLLELLETGRIPDARESTVRAFLQPQEHRDRLLRTPNFGQRSLGELLAATADPKAEAAGDVLTEAAALRVRQEIRRQLLTLRSGVERLERLLDA